jgi:S-adenosyl-L-methionine hydrolase (adenosine-forming)
MPTARFWSHFGFIALVAAMSASFSAFSPASAAPPVIGLFSDFGWDDPYVAQIKGAIISVEPNARILDLMHTVDPFDVTEGAYLLDQAAAEFPAGTIFVAVVDPGVGTDRAPILLETGKEKYYLGPDNGLFTFVIAREGFSHAWKLDRAEYFRAGALSHTFHGRDIFGPVAGHLADGTSPDRVGTPLDEKALTLLPVKEPTFSSGTISTQVLHIDHFGNVILNLPADSDEAQKLKEGDLVKILVGHESYSGPLVRTYADIGKGRLLLVYGGSGLLELGVNQGSAAHMLKVAPGDVIYLRP